MYLLAQSELAATTTAELLKGRSDAMIILIIVVVAVVLWTWKVYLPQMESERLLRAADKEITRTNASTLEALSKVVASIHGDVRHAGTTARAIFELEKLGIDCFEVISIKTGCDLTREIGKMRGVVIAMESGATI